MKKLITLTICAVLVVAAYLSWTMIQFLNKPANQETAEVIFEIPSGTPFYLISEKLYREGLIADKTRFNFFAKISKQTTQLKVGEYLLRRNMTPYEVLKILTEGKSIVHNLTIPEGHNIFNIRDLFNERWPGRGDEFFKIVNDKKIVNELIKTDVPESLEGYLFPETYTFTKFTPMITLVRQMVHNFNSNIQEIRSNAKIKMPLHEHVILASVIEKETGAPEERPLISSVFHNRLEKKMKLQSDPTILYGMFLQTGQVTKSIRRSDILNPTPYNTYTVKALPIGPIANPGKEALFAAVNPANSKYLYFVSRNDGTHVFSESYKDHNRAVKDFQLNRKAREGKSWRDRKNK